ncbi:hypothetical protein [Solwaraspora sp. WMMD792]|uniref:hypothetical protein n=1 Tax=Solwaraspora sp. WMMD792 TaxID=3016099 RepID=UPI0024162A38|nr:hypothetical protein [Solwaraspora sp. WMMD792]MDG4768717.1 hypothetical protein [Solwaraspora sp. WMMD792]
MNQRYRPPITGRRPDNAARKTTSGTARRTSQSSSRYAVANMVSASEAPLRFSAAGRRRQSRSIWVSRARRSVTSTSANRWSISQRASG